MLWEKFNAIDCGRSTTGGKGHFSSGVLCRCFAMDLQHRPGPDSLRYGDLPRVTGNGLFTLQSPRWATPTARPRARRFAADVDAVALLEILRRQRRSKAGVERFGENRDDLFFHLGADLAVGGAAPRPMNHGPVALAARLGQQPPQLPFAAADLLGGLLFG